MTVQQKAQELYGKMSQCAISTVPVTKNEAKELCYFVIEETKAQLRAAKATRRIPILNEIKKEIELI